MKNSFISYLDDFNYITSLIPKNEFSVSLEYFFISSNRKDKIEAISLSESDSYYKVSFILDFDVKLGETYKIITSTNLESVLYMGRVSRSERFDDLYKTDLELGSIYNKNETLFRIWSPYSTYMRLNLYDLDNNVEHIMMKRNSSVFEVRIDKDINNYKYSYTTLINGNEINILDPYSIAIDEKLNLSIVVDKDSLYKSLYNSSNIDTPIIYETSIRDFTSFYKDDISRSSFSAFTSHDSFKHLISLGVNYVEFLPVNLFGGIDYTSRLTEYNWGYNPINYFSLTSEYTLSNNPVDRINEFKRLVDILHKNNIKVIMDVVYNHVYKSALFEYEKLVPEYSFIYDSEGMLKDSSGCGNDLNTSKYMIKRLIMDSLSYLVKEFNVDGFRFDLMGLIDVNTINETYDLVKSLKKDILVFGEGWVMGEYPKNSMATIINPLINNNIGFFNDYYRETIKKYILGNKVGINDLNEAIKRSINYSSNFSLPSRSVNYLECHDDYALIDYLSLHSIEEMDVLTKRALLGILITILSLGIPFIHSGMEFFNSKGKMRNTYNLGDDYNKLDYSKLNKYKDEIESIRKLIEYRNNSSIYKLNNSYDYLEISYLDELLVIKNKKDFNTIYISNNLNKHNLKLNNVIYKTFNIEIEESYIKGIGIVITK